MIKEYIKRAKERMGKTVENLKREFATIRSGRVTPSLLDTVKVDCYGSTLPLKQVASITAPQPNLLVVRPWDPQVIKEIEKAILRSDLGLNPRVDKDLIRIPIPPLSEERREELIKTIRKIAEEARIVVRNHRRQIREEIVEKRQEGEIPEDDARRAEKELQDITDRYIQEIDRLLEIKEKEIRET